MELVCIYASVKYNTSMIHQNGASHAFGEQIEIVSDKKNRH
jgi:hypothetical protein